MAATDVTRTPVTHDGHTNNSRPSTARRLVTETKAAFKTTEFFMTVGAVVAILISAMVIKGGDTAGTDEFLARQAWLYVAIVVGAYTIGRGLAKAGTPDPYTDEDHS